MIFFWFLIFIVALAILIKSSDKFTNAAEVIGSYLGIPSFIIGVTIVAIGTSLPELISSIIATTRGFTDIALANVAGSNIANVFLVLGIAGIIVHNTYTKGKNNKQSTLNFDLKVMMLSTIAFIIFIYDGKVVLGESLILLIGLIGYFVFSILKHTSGGNGFGKMQKHHILEIIFWPILIYIGAKYTIEALIHISEFSGLSTTVISATAVALGTSLPELTVSIAAIRKNKIAMSLGNIIGSNIFNILGVVGITGLFGILTINANFVIISSILILISSMLLLILRDKILNRLLGIAIVLIYIGFIYYLIF